MSSVKKRGSGIPVNGAGRTLFYQISTRHIAAKAVKAIYKTRRFSDYAPLSIDYYWNL